LYNVVINTLNKLDKFSPEQLMKREHEAVTTIKYKMALPMKHDPSLKRTRRKLEEEIEEIVGEMKDYEPTREGRERIIK